MYENDEWADGDDFDDGPAHAVDIWPTIPYPKLMRLLERAGHACRDYDDVVVVSCPGGLLGFYTRKRLPLVYVDITLRHVKGYAADIVGKVGKPRVTKPERLATNETDTN